MGEKEILKEFQRILEVENKKVKRIACPAQRARAMAELDKWAEQEMQTINMLIGREYE